MEINEQAFSTAASGGPYTTIPSGDTGTIINFYTNWTSYLHLNYGFWHSASGYIMNWLVKTIFEADKGLENIYNSVFMLLGWEGDVSKGGPLHTLWVFFQAFGWSLLALGLTIVAFQALNHHTNWGAIATNIIMVAMTMTILPMMMQMFNTIAIDAEKGLNSLTNSEMTADIAIQPIKNNVIDLSTLVRKDFNGFTYKPDSKTIKSVADWNALHTSKDIKELDLGQGLDNQTMKDLKLDKYKAGAAAMQYHLEDEHAQQDGGYVIVKNKAGAGAGSLNDQCYARYSVNWIGLIGQALILGFVLIVSGIRVVKDSYELVLMNFIAPLLAYRSIRSTKKLRDLISSIAGSYTSIVFMMALIRVYLISLPVCQAKVPSMNWFQRSIVILIIYIGGAIAMFAGVNYLERVTGVSQGLSDEVGQVMAAGAVGGAIVGATGGLAGTAMSAAGGMISRFGNRSNSTSHHGSGGITSKLPGQNNTNANQQDEFGQSNQNNSQSQATNELGTSDGTSNEELTANNQASETNNAETNGDVDNQSNVGADGIPGTDEVGENIGMENTDSPDGVPGDVNEGDINTAGNSLSSTTGTEAVESNNEMATPGVDGLNGTNGIDGAAPGVMETDTYGGGTEVSGSNYDPNTIAGTEDITNNSGVASGVEGLNNGYGASDPAGVPGTEDLGTAGSDDNSPTAGATNNNEPENWSSDDPRLSGTSELNTPNDSNDYGFLKDASTDFGSSANDPVLDSNIGTTNKVPDQVDTTNMPVDKSFESQTDYLNNLDKAQPDTNNRIVNPYSNSSQEGNSNFTQSPLPQTTSSPSQHVENVNASTAVRFGKQLQHAGHDVSNISSNLRRHSTNYLKSHRFNLSQNGNIRGRSSEHLD